MDDIEKVIKGLECCSMDLCKDGCCPYWRESKCTPFLAKDALELLKEQPQIVLCKESIKTQTDLMMEKGITFAEKVTDGNRTIGFARTGKSVKGHKTI